MGVGKLAKSQLLDNPDLHCEARGHAKHFTYHCAVTLKLSNQFNDFAAISYGLSRMKSIVKNGK